MKLKTKFWLEYDPETWKQRFANKMYVSMTVPSLIIVAQNILIKNYVMMVIGLFFMSVTIIVDSSYKKYKKEKENDKSY